MRDESKGLSGFAIVEVMGHKRLAGAVSEQTIAGTGFIRVDVPETEMFTGWGETRQKVTIPAFTQLLGAGSIYSITPCSEAVANAAAKSFTSRPVDVLDLATKALPAPEPMAIPPDFSPQHYDPPIDEDDDQNGIEEADAIIPPPLDIGSLPYEPF